VKKNSRSATRSFRRVVQCPLAKYRFGGRVLGAPRPAPSPPPPTPWRSWAGPTVGWEKNSRTSPGTFHERLGLSDPRPYRAPAFGIFLEENVREIRATAIASGLSRAQGPWTGETESPVGPPRTASELPYRLTLTDDRQTVSLAMTRTDA